MTTRTRGMEGRTPGPIGKNRPTTSQKEAKEKKDKGASPKAMITKRRKKIDFLAAVVCRHCGQAAHAYYVSFAGL